MIRQIRYFHSVARLKSFSKAAISQQIHSLEQELGFDLFIRKGRSISLTKAGEYFYNHTLPLIKDLDQIIDQGRKINSSEETVLKTDCLISYMGDEFLQTVNSFCQRYPNIRVEVFFGTHEQLYQKLKAGELDIILNDQRRAYSDEYENCILASLPCFVQLYSSYLSLERSTSVLPEALYDLPCIVIADKSSREDEVHYYQDIIGFTGGFSFVSSMQEAKALIVQNRGFLPCELTPSALKKLGGFGPGTIVGADIHSMTANIDSDSGSNADSGPDSVGDDTGAGTGSDSLYSLIPLYRGSAQRERTYCAFWKKENSGCYIEEFASLLESAFGKENPEF